MLYSEFGRCVFEGFRVPMCISKIVNNMSPMRISANGKIVKPSLAGTNFDIRIQAKFS